MYDRAARSRAGASRRRSPTSCTRKPTSSTRRFRTARSKPLDVLRFSSRRARARPGDSCSSSGSRPAWSARSIPLLTGQVFDRIIPGAERGLLCASSRWCCWRCTPRSSLFDVARAAGAGARPDAHGRDARSRVWDRLLSLPLPFFRRYSAGDLASRAAGIGGIREVLGRARRCRLLLGGVFSLWNFALLFYIDPRLALAATGAGRGRGVVAAIARVLRARAPARASPSSTAGSAAYCSAPHRHRQAARHRRREPRVRRVGAPVRAPARRRSRAPSASASASASFRPSFPILCSMRAVLALGRDDGAQTAAAPDSSWRSAPRSRCSWRRCST